VGRWEATEVGGVSGERVLVVDDEPTVREVVQRYLERDGYQVEAAADGTLALDALAARPSTWSSWT
jgi:CheY-like chemotaxis protein